MTGLQGVDGGWFDKIYAYDVDGLPCNFIKSTCPKISLDRAKDLNLSKDDVVIVSYPKSGTHWISEMIYLIINNYDVYKAKCKIQLDRVFYLEHQHPNGTNYLDILEQMLPPRLMRSHLHSSFFRKTLDDKPIQEQCKFILPFRNPKDILVSYYFFFKLNTAIDCDIPWDTFFEFFRQNKLQYGDPLDWLLTWWVKYRERENILFLAYEGTKRDHAGTVKKIAEFLGQGDISDENIAKVVEATSFNSMQKNMSVNWEIGYPKKKNGVGQFIRKGAVGDWTNYFSDEQSAYVDAMIEKKYKPLGIPYADKL